MYFAHSTGDRSRSNWQPLCDHLNMVAQLAASRGDKFGAGKAAAFAGILHDLGKYSEGFQRRLDGARDRIDHSTAGAQLAGRLATEGADRGMGELIAYAIAGHHAGLPNKEGDGGSLAERLGPSYAIPSVDPAWENELLVDAKGLIPKSFSRHPDTDRLPFQLAFLGRMIFSCLVDADFRDTEDFYASVDDRTVDRDWRALPDIIDRLIVAFDEHMAAKQSRVDRTNVNTLRAEILTHVRGGANEPQGLFTLTVPTGGGKTLASLGFALDHAKRYRLERVIYAIPFTSVIDQTAQTFRDVFETVDEEVVLEHHSAIDEERLRQREGPEKLRLAMEDWAAPVVVTTNVQVFESLFANRPSRCRKLHNLTRAVIVLDEAQTIPLHVLRPAVAALDELSRNYGTSIVLCTATQPALAAPEFCGGFATEVLRELAPEPKRLHRALKRVTVEQRGELSDDDLLTALANTQQGLVIVNSRAHALSLYRKGADAGLDGMTHLTTRQYAAHRQQILADVRARLKDGHPCRLVATSLVESGIDLDFPRVWRAEAGLDQIAQAAGRCNREGVRPIDDSIVTVFRAAENPPPREIAQLAGDFERIASDHTDLLSPGAIRDYFGEVYWRKGAALDSKNVLDAFKVDSTGTDFAYRTVAEDFRLIESGFVPVIVARDGAARRALDKLATPTSNAGSIARELQRFTVQIPPKARSLLLANGHVRFREERRFCDQFAVLVTEALYWDETGLLWEEAGYLRLERYMI